MISRHTYSVMDRSGTRVCVCVCVCVCLCVCVCVCLCVLRKTECEEELNFSEAWASRPVLQTHHITQVRANSKFPKGCSEVEREHKGKMLGKVFLFVYKK